MTKEQIQEIAAEINSYREVNHLNTKEESAVLEALAACDNNDIEYLTNFVSFGEDTHHRIRNIEMYNKALSLGFTSREISNYGWIEHSQYEFKNIEEIGFKVKKDNACYNHFEIGQAPNGQWTYGFMYSMGATGGGGASGISVMNTNLFSSKESCIANAVEYFIKKFSKEIEESTEEKNNTVYCKQVLNKILEYKKTLPVSNVPVAELPAPAVVKVVNEPKPKAKLNNNKVSGSYKKFIENKIIKTPNCGFEVKESDLHPSDKPHQKDIITWAANGGNRAIFGSFGTGKTQMQLELMRLAISNTKIWNEGQFGLIIMPLGVKGEFKKDAERLGMDIQYVRNNDEVKNRTTPYLITNYERVRDGGIDIKAFPELIFVSLDEASVLRSYGSKTYQEFLPMFQQVPYKYVCTATPSPNKYKEIIHYAGFLGIMDTGQALTRFFKRDSTKANHLTLYEHKEREFWLWVSSWAVFITKPSDLGYDDTGYDLPNIHIHWEMINSENDGLNVDRDGQTKMFKDVAVSLSQAAKEKRVSILDRVIIADEIIRENGPDKHWILWHHLESEREVLEANIPDVVSVYGSQDETEKEALLMGFSNGDFKRLATKASIAGQGCNFQYHCSNAIFLGINYEFNDFIQALHRIYRYQQSEEVNIYIIFTEAEEHIKRELEAKWRRHNELVNKMTSIIKEYGLTQLTAIGELKRSIGIERKEVKGELFTYVNNDSVIEYAKIEDNRFGMGLTSIPFSNHYEYTPSYNDFGHTNNDDHFFQQMDFLTPHKLRTLKPGRIQIVHVKDRIMFGNVTGYGVPTVNPFHAKTIFHYIKHGFLFLGMITIETDVVRENNQTYRLGWSEKCKDGSKMGVGSPEYLLIFRKPQTDTTRAYADEPVVKSKEEFTRGNWQIDARAKWNSSGDSLLTPAEIRKLGVDVLSDRFSEHFKEHIYNYEQHVITANALDKEGKLPATFEMLKVPARTNYVWDDIVRMRTLNSKQTQSKEQNHICPFQLDIVDRCIELWSNEGDEIADCFGGIGSVGVESIKLNRKAHLCELNPEYFSYGVGYCKEAEYKKKVPTLFDYLEKEAV